MRRSASSSIIYNSRLWNAGTADQGLPGLRPNLSRLAEPCAEPTSLLGGRVPMMREEGRVDPILGEVWRGGPTTIIRLGRAALGNGREG